MPPAEAPVLEALGLGKRYGPTPVLRGVDLALDPGDVLLLLGSNGSGKTTLLRILAGLARPTAGAVRLHGAPFRPGDTALRRRLGFLSHQTHLYDELTLRENLVFAARIQGLPDRDEAAAAALGLAGLAGRADQRVGGLSRGMQQRAALARAFLHRPDILLLDEPFTALDADAAESIRTWLAARAYERCTLVIVTHQPEALWDLATQVGVLASGRWAIREPRPATPAGFQDRYREAVRV